MVSNNNHNEEKIFMTKEAIDGLKLKLDKLINIVRPEVLKELSEARKQGDLSENADYDSAREKQAEIESEIAKIETILINVEEIKSVNNDIIEISNVVSFEDDNLKETKIIKLVSSPIEIDPFSEVINIAVNSPIGKAMLGKKVGDVIEIETNNNISKIKILKIQ